MRRKWGGGGSARARGNLESLAMTFWDLTRNKKIVMKKDSAGVKSKPVTSDRLVKGLSIDSCHTGMEAIRVQPFKCVTDVHVQREFQQL